VNKPREMQWGRSATMFSRAGSYNSALAVGLEIGGRSRPRPTPGRRANSTAIAAAHVCRGSGHGPFGRCSGS